MFKINFLLFFCVLINVNFLCATRFHVIREWKFINFTWSNENNLQAAINNGQYIPENNLIAGIKYYDDYYYLTIPRMKNGVPATLARISNSPLSASAPLLEPFPSWQMNNINDCNALQFVQNIEIDQKGQLWIIDSGRVNTLTTSPIIKCPPKLLIYNLKTMKLNTVYNFPDDVATKEDAYLYDLVIDDTDSGYAYITDNSARRPGIIVYSVKENRAWKIYDPQSMSANQNAMQLTVNGFTISSPINIAGIALGPKIKNNQQITVMDDRQVYYSPLSSFNLYAINSTILRNSGNNGHINIRDLGIKKSQSVSMIMDNKGILYYSLLGLNGIGRWDSETTFSNPDNQKLIAQDEKYIEWPHSFTFDRNGNLTIVVNRLNRFVFNKTDLNEPNYRLISANVGGDSYIFDDYTYHNQNSSNYGLNQSTSSTMESMSTSTTTMSTTAASSTIHPDLQNHQKSVHQVHTQSSGTRILTNSLLFFFGFLILFS